MKNLVKSMVLALVMMCSTTVFAQQGSHGVGVNFGYQAGARSVSNVGLGIKYNYMITDHLRGEVNGMYYFQSAGASLTDLNFTNKKYFKTNGNEVEYLSGKDTEWIDVNINAHYLFDIGEKFHAYPVFGFTAMFGRTHFNYIDKFGGNIPVDSFFALKEGDKSTAYSDTHFRPGVNLGAGMQYDITDDFALTFEAKYKLIKHFGNFNMAIGCIVLF